MKIDRRTFINKMNWGLAGIIGLLGFAGCEKIGGKVEYGTPNAEFTVKGTVVDKTTGKPIEGIRVVVPRVDHHQRPTSGFIPDQRVISSEVHDTLYTKGNGIFEYKYNGIQTNDSTNIIFKFEDIAEIKRFKTDSAKVTFFQSDLKGGKSWYQGGATKEVTVELNNIEHGE
jgi:putative lipoprotein (rSAM/lipoprotein system)